MMIDGVSKLLLWLIGVRPNLKAPPKYRLVPDDQGTYTLEKWHDDISTYICESVYLTPDTADKVIERLEGNIIYYRER